MDSDELEMLLEARLQLGDQNQNLSDNELICECHCISLEQIREIVGKNEVNLTHLSEVLGLGTGCSSCLKKFEQWKGKI